jgi:copper chaperone CopZ
VRTKTKPKQIKNKNTDPHPKNMSRREEEFKHRTSIFEGAYRAWSHLGGLDPDILLDSTKTVKDLDPINFPLINDPRIPNVTTTGSSIKKNTKVLNDDGTARYEYPYEPLPRCGLTHPYIQAILSPWLGPNADNDAIELGLGTLRTWWQHRRKGENKSAVKTLGTAKMRIVVDQYTRHFFDLAYCLVTNDNVQAPRTLHLKLKQSSNVQHRLLGTCTKYGDGIDDDEMSASVGSNNNSNNNNNYSEDFLSSLTPLERMHVVQKNFVQNQQSSGSNDSFNNNSGRIVIKGKCIPGKIDLAGIVDAVKRHANNLTYRGGGMNKNGIHSSSKLGKNSSDGGIDVNVEEVQYGDPNTTPILFVTNQGKYIIVMKVDGITCAHCVKIVETVLKGCSGTGKSPISGLIDAAADHAVSSVVVLIDNPNHAKRISFEATRNLSLVGYTAQSMEVQLLVPTDRTNTTNTTTDQMIRDTLQKTVLDIAKAYPVDFFDFAAPCSCPDSGVYRNNCPRYETIFIDLCSCLVSIFF